MTWFVFEYSWFTSSWILSSYYRFAHCCRFFVVKPKTGDTSISPKDFFSLWISFCSDFKDLWKREQQRLIMKRSVTFLLSLLLYHSQPIPWFFMQDGESTQESKGDTRREKEGCNQQYVTQEQERPGRCISFRLLSLLTPQYMNNLYLLCSAGPWRRIKKVLYEIHWVSKGAHHLVHNDYVLRFPFMESFILCLEIPPVVVYYASYAFLPFTVKYNSTCIYIWELLWDEKILAIPLRFQNFCSFFDRTSQVS